MIDALESGDNVKLLHYLTDDWQGFGIYSVHPANLNTRDQNIVEILCGDVAIKNTELIDLETQVRGDAAAVFYLVRCEVTLSEGGLDIPVVLRFGDVFRRENGQWKQMSTHINLVADTNVFDS